ncbi:MAG: MBL fold metallo-hydrolase [Deltaproteobacteria bacterium]|nr:MBL fold metallo-hydrolase [Deltaproteobacteria bacterium]MBN2844795.1 MBL fold metallo-hydrolase [Deltaproteobacteria bacterium]
MRIVAKNYVIPVLIAIMVTLLSACAITKPPEVMDLGAQPDLARHSEEFRKEIITVTDGVYVAVGYGLANAILIEGDDGVIIVDTLESVEAARPVKEAFNRITSKPVKAIIYTHNHADHIFGATVFAGDDNPDVYSHETTLYYIDRILSIIRPTIYRRSMRQFGTLLPEGGLINAGIGPRLVYDMTKTTGLIRPNKTFSGERLDLEIAGVKLDLFLAPGETNDQIALWLPEKKTLLCADNYYKSFPNLYAIRGTAYRDVNLWVKSIDTMRALRPEYLVPGHTRPVTGADRIYETLTNYRDAIQFVHDQTIRHMNLGFTPDEIVERVKLPPHLAKLPYLHEYYGTVPWSVRAVYNGYIGWFDGNPSNLFPLPPRERAERFAEIAGGKEKILKEATKAVSDGEYQWALELTDYLLVLEPENQMARNCKARALRTLGERQIAATARNYYLTRALELEGTLFIGEQEIRDRDLVHSIPLTAIFNSMAVNLNAEKSADVERVVGFRFPDTGDTFTVHVRRGVAEIQPRLPENPDNTVTVNSLVWKEIVAGMRNPALALVKGDVSIEGGTFELVKFLALFK